ncbi:hypothetical protein [Roseomonas elaeocarpi]|uniref:TIGR02301 family protein n=1 Tax=Roseomonas elaeocarpi TaxID=907779 RepID=A0ABV6JT10_9PROT
MMPSRFLLAGLVSAFVGAASPVFAQGACLQPAEKTAFDVRALQSQMMVVALSCKHEDVYNAFVTRYSSQLSSAIKVIDASYRRAGGQKAMDGYITNMANQQSQEGIRMGSRFCGNSAELMQSAMAAPVEPAALAKVTEDNNLSNPHGRSECTGSAVTAAKPERPAARPARVRSVSTHR